MERSEKESKGERESVCVSSQDEPELEKKRGS